MMLRWLNRVPSFGNKVTWLLTLTSGLAVMLVSVALIVLSYQEMRRELIASVQSRIRVVALNSGPALSFDDAQGARETLNSLRGSAHIASATLFTAEGKRLASYSRKTLPAPLMPLGTVGLTSVEPWLLMTAPVNEANARVGSVQIVFDTQQLNRRIGPMLLAALGVALVTVLAIYLLARRIRHVLVGPIDNLARTARKVTETGNYSLRATRVGVDEIGQFTEDFNLMLGQIQQQHAEIQSARRSAEQAGRLKDEFLATLSHELRTPMTPILGWAQVLLRSAHDPVRVVEGAEAIERNARLQTQLIDDLLDMSRIISGKLILDIQQVRVQEVVEAAMATVTAAAAARGVELRTAFDATRPTVNADPARLQQIIWNLLTNAIKFTPRGGWIETSVSRSNGQVEIAVCDSGQGIADEFLPHVFERFRQADSSTTRVHGGLGLGLAIVKQLTEQHGGTVSVESEGTDCGARFVVRIPTPDAEPPAGGLQPADRPGPLQANLPLRGMQVLLVDDAPDTCQLITRLLTDAGAEVEAVGTADAALTAISTLHPDVMISDIGLPGCDGYELLSRVRRLASHAGGDTPAIALTGFAREVDRQRALAAGFQVHLSKPVEAVDLVRATASLRRRAQG